jgi:hypothetical protein
MLGMSQDKEASVTRAKGKGCQLQAHGKADLPVVGRVNVKVHFGLSLCVQT